MAEVAVQHHHPAKLNSGNLKLDFNVFAKELAAAQYALGRLEGSQKELKATALLVSPLSAKEATVSSRIEGTESTVSDVFVSEAGGQTPHSDVRQVLNYRKAIRYAIDQIQNQRPLTPHLAKTLHSMLLDRVRHKGRLGQFRNNSVWIGQREGDPIDKALYVPPEHYLVQDYIDDLFAYIDDASDDPLILSGIAHYGINPISWTPYSP